MRLPPPTYPSTRPLGGDAHEEGLFPDLEGTRKRLRTPFPGSRTGSNDHLPLWLITFRELPERPAVRGPAPFEPGRSAGGGEARASLDERARSRRQGRPALRSRGRAHAHAAGLTMPLETTTSCGRPESRICQFLALGNTRRRVPGRAVSRVPSSALGGLLFALPQPIGTHALGDSLSFLGRLLGAPALGRGAAGRRLCRHRGRGRTGRPPLPRLRSSSSACTPRAGRRRTPGEAAHCLLEDIDICPQLVEQAVYLGLLARHRVRDGLTDLLEDVVHTEERNVPSDTVSNLLVSSVRVHTKL